MQIPLRDGRVVLTTDAFDQLRVRMADISDPSACACCAEECSSTLSVVVEFCDMIVEKEIAIPGQFTDISEPQAELEDGSYMYVTIEIACTPCGWTLGIGICAFCVATNQSTGESWTALIPFADEEEAGGGSCPQPGAVDLECFGLQFGIPCITTASATIS
jgi:hypothetical protein